MGDDEPRLPPTPDEWDEVLNVLEDCLRQECLRPDGTLFSMALSSFADGLRVLAKHGRVIIVEERGRSVIVRYPDVAEILPGLTWSREEKA